MDDEDDYRPDLTDIVPFDGVRPYDVRKVIEQVVDADSFMEIQENLQKISSLGLQGLKENRWSCLQSTESIWQADLILIHLIKQPDLFVSVIHLIFRSLRLKMLLAFSQVLNKNMAELFATGQKFCMPIPKQRYQN